MVAALVVLVLVLVILDCAGLVPPSESVLAAAKRGFGSRFLQKATHSSYNDVRSGLLDVEMPWRRFILESCVISFCLMIGGVVFCILIFDGCVKRLRSYNELGAFRNNSSKNKNNRVRN